MNNIEKLAIEHGKASNTVMRYNEMSQQMLLDGYNFTRSELEAFAKALQSSEPVVEVIIDSVAAGLINGKRQGLPMGMKLFTHPPASVSLEKYNKLLDGIRNCLKWANGRQAEWGTRAENAFEFLEKAIAEAEGKEG